MIMLFLSSRIKQILKKSEDHEKKSEGHEDHEEQVDPENKNDKVVPDVMNPVPPTLKPKCKKKTVQHFTIQTVGIKNERKEHASYHVQSVTKHLPYMVTLQNI